MKKSKAYTKEITASSRASIKRGDNYFTIEFSECVDVSNCTNIDFEREHLWEVVNGEVDRQLQEIDDALKKERAERNVKKKTHKR